LSKPGPQAINQIAGTAAEQFARAFQPAPPRPLSARSLQRLITLFQNHRAELAPVLFDILADDIAALAANIVKLKLEGAAHG
jgi:hypothetical protein